MTSIQRRLTVTLLATVLTLAAGAGALLYLFARARLLAEFDAVLTARAQALAAAVVWENHEQLEFNYVADEHPDFREAGRRAFFEIRRADGTVFARSPSLGGRDLPGQSLAAGAADDDGGGGGGGGGAAWIRDLALPGGRPGRAAALRFVPHPDADDPPAPPGARPGPVLTVVVARDRGRLDHTLWVLRSSLLLAGLALSAGTLVAVTLAVRGALRPLRRLAADADAIDAASLHHRFGAADLPAELAPIAHGLNSLLARLAAAFDRERRFTADVSHELRTPLAELRALAEVALRWPEATPPEQNYRDVLGVVRQMEGLVTTLLAIARLEAGAQPVCDAATDLRAVLDAAWQAHRVTAAERGLAVAWDVPHGTTVRSDPALLLPMLGNLLSNAVAYTPARGRVRVASRALAGGRVELEMSNPCEGLRPEDIPNLSDRFWRSDPARVNGHSGLGLSLVREYARATGASVSHRLSDDGLFTASVVLPAGDGNGHGNGNGNGNGNGAA